MRVLVVGSGAREHALVWKFAHDGVADLACAPGNPGIARLARLLPVDSDDPETLLTLARREAVDLTIVGPETPLARGVRDRFEAAGLLVMGPTRAAARLEYSKTFAKEFMGRHGIPTARYRVCRDAAEALAIVGAGILGFPIVIKADGLAAGKGVTVAPDRETAATAVEAAMVARRFGQAGDCVVLEEFLEGEEASFFVLCDGERALRLPTAQDHKRAFDDDQGPNTGGMGAFAPTPLIGGHVAARVMAEIVEPVLAGMRAEGSAYRGILYVGLMLTQEGPRVVEFNVRLGDPEAQVILPMLDSDLLPLCVAAASGSLHGVPSRLRTDPHVGVVVASGGYPGHYEVGQPILGLETAEAMEGVLVFHAGTAVRDAQIVTAGGRVLTVVAHGSSYGDAAARAYAAVSQITFEGAHYRRDIGRKALRASAKC